jgi:hypothetical protein
MVFKSAPKSQDASAKENKPSEASQASTKSPALQLRGMNYAEQVAAMRPVQADGGNVSAAEGVHTAAARGVQGSGGTLPHAAQIQHSFGSHDVSNVQAHVGGAAQTAAASIGAEAYATGSDVAFASEPSLHTAAHEAAHVVQQRGGSVQLKDGVGQAGDSYEQHADAVADLVVQGKSAESLLNTYADSQEGSASGDVQQKSAVQRVVGHTTGAQVDTYLKASPFIADYVAQKFANGIKADGHVHIHTPAAFITAWIAYAMVRTNPDTAAIFTEAEARAWEPNVNAYQEGTEIHIHQDRGEAGTAIHESIHLFADTSYMATLGFNANEGTTEYFTRMICTEQNITRGSFYVSNRQSIEALVAATSQELVAKAYFNGAIAALRTTVDASKGAGTFSTWTSHMQAGNYGAANGVL